MSAFEFFFSFYGLLLGLSVAVIATGLASSIQHRRRIRFGWKTPMLALFVALDIASFWDSAWTNFQHLPFSYGLLVVGLAIALVYFIAASLVFPHEIEDGLNLDDHFWANKKVVLLLLVAANTLGLLAAVPANLARPHGDFLLINYAVAISLYYALIIPAALARKATLFAVTIGLHIVIYIFFAVITPLQALVGEGGQVNLPEAPAAGLPRDAAGE